MENRAYIRAADHPVFSEPKLPGSFQAVSGQGTRVNERGK
jgi:hypothetical protein